MATTTGGELAARALIETGAEYLFTLSGGHITPIYSHLEDSPVKMFDTRHEQAAVFMAEAWGRMTRKPGIAMVTAGPGFTKGNFQKYLADRKTGLEVSFHATNSVGKTGFSEILKKGLGVKAVEELEIVNEIGADFIQGHLLAKPSAAFQTSPNTKL